MPVPKKLLSAVGIANIADSGHRPHAVPGRL